jgi:hypothetical protein
VENIKGPTTAFGTFSPYKSLGLKGLVWSYISLLAAWTQTTRARYLKFLHTAHFSVVTPCKLKRAGLKGEGIRRGALLFMSAYNGDADVYFRGFSDNVADVLDTVWGGCVDWRGASPYADLDYHIKRYQRPSLAFFNAYPDTCSRIRHSLVLRRQLDKLYAQALSNDSPDAFKASFDRIAQIHWGNLPATMDDL